MGDERDWQVGGCSYQTRTLPLCTRPAIRCTPPPPPAAIPHPHPHPNPHPDPNPHPHPNPHPDRNPHPHISALTSHLSPSPSPSPSPLTLPLTVIPTLTRAGHTPSGHPSAPPRIACSRRCGSTRSLRVTTQSRGYAVHSLPSGMWEMTARLLPRARGALGHESAPCAPSA